MGMKVDGNILKMQTTLGAVVDYTLPIGDARIAMNPLIGKKIQLTFKGQINCIETGEKIKKSYNQGYSYKSFITLAACDMCIMKPETCHFAKGTCREPEWAQTHCMIPHVVYLANSSGIKVGITREGQIPTRWMDQGATQALPILRVKDRLTSGLIEVELAKKLGDKTDWRKMLQGKSELIDLKALQSDINQEFSSFFQSHHVEILQQTVVDIEYPIDKYPQKISSYNLDKEPVIEDRLMGIKGQYLIFEKAVINLRKYQGYYLYLEA
jgi:hypothetical protein